LNEFCLKDSETKKVIKNKCVTEKDVFKFLGYDYVKPEDR